MRAKEAGTAGNENAVAAMYMLYQQILPRVRRAMRSGLTFVHTEYRLKGGRPAKAMLTVLAAVMFGSGAPAPAGIQAQLDALSASGGNLRLPHGARTVVTSGVVLPVGVTLDLNGGELLAILDEANEAGVRLLTGSSLINGTVTVVSRGEPGIQAGAHAPVLIGALLGESPDHRRVSPFEAPSHWRVSGVTLRSDKRVQVDGIGLGAPAIQIMGGAHHGLIEDILVPDSDRMAGGVFLDWGTVGAISSNDIPGNASRFAAGVAYTTHPHHITIRRVSVGRLSRPALGEAGSMAVRLSGVHDVTVEDVQADLVTEAGFRFTAGDLGFEFALGASRQRAHQGIIVSGLRAGSAGAYLVRTDSYADNVGRAVAKGYRAALPPIAETDLAVADVSGTWDSTGMPGWGLRVDHQRGGTFTRFDVRGFRIGFVIDEQVEDVVLQHVNARESVDAAFQVGHPARPPRRIRAVAVRATGNGAGARVARLEHSEDVVIEQSSSLQIRRSPQAVRIRIDTGGLN